MPTRFTAIPTVPLAGIEPWQVQLLSAMKENIELLTGTRGEADFASAALTRAALTVSPPAEQVMTQVSAQGNGVSISNRLQARPTIHTRLRCQCRSHQ